MPRHIAVEPHGRFAQALADRLKEIGMDLRELSEKVENSYEHCRKMRAGDSLPSNQMLRAVCLATGLDLHEMKKLVTADKIKTEYGDIPEELAGKDPSMAKLERLWKHLGAADRRVLEASA
ncbi:MAG TPA: hypothetical protein VJN48_00960 [Terriglobales bacterium]|nr:hypothetical protein [Terriglobales bacterium]